MNMKRTNLERKYGEIGNVINSGSNSSLDRPHSNCQYAAGVSQVGGKPNKPRGRQLEPGESPEENANGGL